MILTVRETMMTYQTSMRSIAVSIALSVLAVANVQAEDTLSVGASLKLWNNNWTSWGMVNSPASGGSYQVIVPISSGTEPAVTPAVNIQYGNLFANMSTMLSTKYDLNGALNGNTVNGATRKEFDINGGYYLMPGLGAFVGYKKLEQNFSGTDYTWSGPILGIAGGAPLGSSAWSLYGQIALGFFNATLPPDASGKTEFDANYTLGEFGLQYGFGNLSFMKSLNVSGGYRMQTVVTKDFGLGVTPLNQSLRQYGTQDLRDVTQGFTLGVSARF